MTFFIREFTDLGTRNWAEFCHFDHKWHLRFPLPLENGRFLRERPPTFHLCGRVYGSPNHLGWFREYWDKCCARIFQNRCTRVFFREKDPAGTPSAWDLSPYLFAWEITSPSKIWCGELHRIWIIESADSWFSKKYLKELAPPQVHMPRGYCYWYGKAWMEQCGITILYASSKTHPDHATSASASMPNLSRNEAILYSFESYFPVWLKIGQDFVFLVHHWLPRRREEPWPHFTKCKNSARWLSDMSGEV